MNTNYNKKSLENILPTNGSKWNNKQTTSIRIPTILKDDVMDYALYIDKDGVKYDKLVKVYDYLSNLSDKLGNETGYKSNGSGKLIKELKSLIDECQ